MFILFWSGPKWCMVNFSQIRLKRLNASGHLVVTNFSKSCWTVTKFNYVLFGFLKSHILPVIVIWNDRLEKHLTKRETLFTKLAKTPILERCAVYVHSCVSVFTFGQNMRYDFGVARILELSLHGLFYPLALLSAFFSLPHDPFRQHDVQFDWRGHLTWPAHSQWKVTQVNRSVSHWRCRTFLVLEKKWPPLGPFLPLP